MVSVLLEGGLCNQMFQTAFIYAYAKKHGFDYCVPTVVNNPHIDATSRYMFPGISYYNMEAKLPIYKEKGFAYQEIPAMDNVCFDGFWQSYKYFDDFRDEILKAFGFKWEMKKNVCAIHVRRGDYLQWPDHHPVITEKYLRNAIEHIYTTVGNKIKFKFFSNDIGWCKSFGEKTFLLYPEMVEYSEGLTELEDLQEASCCEHFIGSNSAYSLWISYLNQNPNKICTFPRKWFGPLLPHNTDDLYPPYATIV